MTFESVGDPTPRLVTGGARQTQPRRPSANASPRAAAAAASKGAAGVLKGGDAAIAALKGAASRT
jgi:hypothetical protein